MKDFKPLKWLFLLLANALLVSASAQLSKGEYFFDTDPGIGNGTPLTGITLLNGAGLDSSEAAMNITIPANMTPGIHYLFVRFKNSDSAWSLYERRQIIVLPASGISIPDGEYFFDTDPGIGAGTPISLSGNTEEGEYTGSVSTTGLTAGYHNLYIRARGANGSWSLYEKKVIRINAAGGLGIPRAEYFYDTDPGPGNGTPLTLSGNTDSSTYTGGVSTTGLAAGFHQLYIRAQKADGSWGLYETRRIKVLPSGDGIAKAEYFFDTDPGPGNGSPLTVVSAGPDSASYTGNISTTGLSSGYHFLYIRAKGTNGAWSQYEKQRIFVNAAIVAAEYFYDTDPGVGAATPLTLTPSGSEADFSGAASTTACMAVGQHKLYVRARNSDGVWGLYDSLDVYLNPTPATASIASPGPGPNGTPLRLSGTGGCGSSFQYQNLTDGSPAQASNRFLVPNGSTTQFRIFDGAGNADTLEFVAPVTPPNQAVAGTASQTVTLDGWNEWVFVRDAGSNIMAAVHDGGKDLGDVVVQSHVNTADTVRRSSDLSGYYLDRNWKITSTKSPVAAAIAVRLYITADEYDSLAVADPTIDSPADMAIIKYNGANENLSVSDNNGTYSYPSTDVQVYNGVATQGYYLECTVTGFSEFYVGSGPGIILPLRLLNFTAQKAPGGALLGWKTADMVGVKGFEVQRSTDGIHYTPQGFVPATAADRYSFSQPLTASGTYYYRLRMVDMDGRFTYSPVRMVSVNSAATVLVYPSPATTQLHIVTSSAAGFRYRVLDAAGRQVLQGTSVQAAIVVPLTSLQTGLYIVETEADGVKTVQRIVKQ